MLALILNQIFFPSLTYALTSGPSQPEMQSFQPAGTTDMVDLFSGDFSYNIPLFELPGPNGGYPFNLSYQAGIGMDQEASWVGLGWSLNPGAINRQMRGLPDEFKGDSVITKMSISPSVTIGLGAGVNAEIFGGNLNIGVGFGVNYNSYKGAGYSIDGSLGFQRASGGMSAGLGIDFSVDSKEGVNVNPSLSLGSEVGQFGLGVGYNSKEGLTNVSLNTSAPRSVQISSPSVGVTLSLAHPSYTPQISMPMRNINLATTFKIGGSFWGVFGSLYAHGFYNEQWLANNKKKTITGAFGYLHYQNVSDPSSLMDFNREKDGMVTKESPNLAIPSLSYDIYSVSGQGISAMYRPMRNDFGRINDPLTASYSVGGALGVDLGPALAHIGVNYSIDYSRSTSGPWSGNNGMAGPTTSQDSKIDHLYEPWYFKIHGEAALDRMDVINDLGGDRAVRVKLSGPHINPAAEGNLESGSWSHAVPVNANINQERKPRTQVIQNFTNEQLVGTDGKEILPHFMVNYIDEHNVEKKFVRDRYKHPHHIAAFSALTAEGLRYNYGIPAYNILQEEVTFTASKKTGQVDRIESREDTNSPGDPNYSVSNTDKYLKRVQLPPFAHSYLLTSILGPDYVDVTGDGVSEDDLGYWVKFTYKNTTPANDPYQWRDPYFDAHFQEGWKTDPRDDKGSFVYGTKELWYLSRAETKSHIATFAIAERTDAMGVSSKFQNSESEKGKPVYKLSEIRLFSRFSGTAIPIKVVKFEHDYSLCNSVDNALGGGKLTLKKLWFEYGTSNRGSLNPYVFDYHDDLSNNPRYDIHAYDRWGNFKPHPTGDFMYNNDAPYCEQDPLKKDQIDSNAGVWSLKEIKLPSGGRIKVDYESDDYGYVQHLPAMQMVEIVDPTGGSADKFNLTDSNMRIRFKLESVIHGPLADAQQKSEVLKYLDTRRGQVYFKVKINLRSTGENFHEFISGYADINTDPATMGLEQDPSGNFTYGYFEVNSEKGRHPFSLRAWQHLRINQPDLANSDVKLEQTDDSGKRVDQIKSLGSIGAQIRQLFEGFNSFCSKAGWGREVIAGKSWVRLNSPDKIKYGGGLRVRQITMTDQWGEDEEGIYGQVYEYTTEENTKQISSGVATFEPFIGGDENALRYAKRYVESVPLRSDNNLFFEYPINETYYPGPQVGYSKVTVTSLAAASMAGKDVKNVTLSDGRKLFPNGNGISYGTSGQTVHEFYTAKDFPVITDETEKKNIPYKLSIPVPMMGNISISKLATSQGYSIVTNDMHGKQKKVSNYRQDRNGIIEPTPISWVKYNYVTKSRIYDHASIMTLSNTFSDNNDGTVSLANGNTSGAQLTFGQENEFFTDMRQFEDNTWTGGLNTNVDFIEILWFVVPIFTAWPSISKNTTQLRTVVTNKVIFKSGVLESTEAFDGGSLVKTQNLKWNKVTGAPVLTMVTNDFDAAVYNYTIPAFNQYQGMGAAYQNTGLTFSIHNVSKVTFKETLYEFSTGTSIDNLVPGDEIILYAAGQLATPLASAVFIGKQDGQNVLYCKTPLTATDYSGMIARSGYRNQLNVSAGTITALDDPSKKGTEVSYQKMLKVPQ